MGNDPNERPHLSHYEEKLAEAVERLSRAEAWVNEAWDHASALLDAAGIGRGHANVRAASDLARSYRRRKMHSESARVWVYVKAMAELWSATDSVVAREEHVAREMRLRRKLGVG